MTWTRQPIRHAITGHDAGVKHRCTTDRHEPVTYNPWLNASFCACGRITRPGNVARPRTAREVCEAWAGRTDHRLLRDAIQRAREQNPEAFRFADTVASAIQADGGFGRHTSTPTIPVVIAASWTFCHDCGTDLDRGDEAALADTGDRRVIVCLDCRDARLEETP